MQDLSPSEIEAILKGIGQTATVSPSNERETSESSPQNISRVQFSQLQEEQTDTPAYPQQEGLKEVKLKVDVVLGRSKMSLQQLLALKEGQLISLNKLAGEPLEIEINGRVIGYGEVVAIDEHYGVHLTKLI
jgi:flagellar motor switch protein FliN